MADETRYGGQCPVQSYVDRETQPDSRHVGSERVRVGGGGDPIIEMVLCIKCAVLFKPDEVHRAGEREGSDAE